MRAIRIAVPSSCWQSRQLGRTSYFESDSRQDFLKYKAPKWVQIKDVDCETEAAKRSQVMVRTMFPSARWESPCARRKELLESACSTARSTSE